MSALEDLFRSLANGPKFEQPPKTYKQAKKREYYGAGPVLPENPFLLLGYMSLGGFGDSNGNGCEISRASDVDNRKHMQPVL